MQLEILVRFLYESDRSHVSSYIRLYGETLLWLDGEMIAFPSRPKSSIIFQTTLSLEDRI